MSRETVTDAGRRYGFALLVTASAIGVARLLDPVLAPHLSPPYFVAVLIASAYGGAGPGLMTTALATIAIAYFDLGQSARLSLGADDTVRLAAFAITALVISSISAARQAAERKLQSALEQLAAADQARDEFLALISHELRTPLTSILGWASLLRDGRLDEESQRMAIESIEQSATTQTMLVSDMLESSRIVLGKVELVRAPFSLRELLQEVVIMLQPVAVAEGLEVTLKAEEATVIVGDRERLKQVFWNLLSNAIKFTDRGGRISVILTTRDAAAHVDVIDTGRGLEKDMLPVIFDRFRQAKGAARKGGLGLGLSIARHMVELHNGELRAMSEGRGKGSTFRVKLPLPHSQAVPKSG